MEKSDYTLLFTPQKQQSIKDSMIEAFESFTMDAEPSSSDTKGDDKVNENGLMYLTYIFTVDPQKYQSYNYKPETNAQKVLKRRRAMANQSMTVNDEWLEEYEDLPLEGEIEQSNMVAMDAASAAKAPTKESCKTTFAQCQAANPLFCRFHGPKLLEADIKQAIKKSGGFTCSVSVTKDSTAKKNTTFRLTVGFLPHQKKIVEDVIHHFLTKNPGITSNEEYTELKNGKETVEFEMDVLQADAPPSKNDFKGQASVIKTKAAQIKGKKMAQITTTPPSIEKELGKTPIKTSIPSQEAKTKKKASIEPTPSPSKKDPIIIPKPQEKPHPPTDASHEANQGAEEDPTGLKDLDAKFDHFIKEQIQKLDDLKPLVEAIYNSLSEMGKIIPLQKSATTPQWDPVWHNETQEQINNALEHKSIDTYLDNFKVASQDIKSKIQDEKTSPTHKASFSSIYANMISIGEQQLTKEVSDTQNKINSLIIPMISNYLQGTLNAVSYIANEYQTEMEKGMSELDGYDEDYKNYKPKGSSTSGQESTETAKKELADSQYALKILIEQNKQLYYVVGKKLLEAKEKCNAEKGPSLSLTEILAYTGKIIQHANSTIQTKNKQAEKHLKQASLHHYQWEQTKQKTEEAQKQVEAIRKKASQATSTNTPPPSKPKAQISKSKMKEKLSKMSQEEKLNLTIKVAQKKLLQASSEVEEKYLQTIISKAENELSKLAGNPDSLPF